MENKKIFKKFLVLTTLLLGIIPTTVFAAGDKDIFEVLTKDEHGIPTSGYYNDGRYKAKNHEKVIDYVSSVNPKISKSDVAANPNLIYTRNGYGGGYVDKNKTVFDTEWSFNILSPKDAAGTSEKKIEQYYKSYIPKNANYSAGERGKAAGYPK